MKGYKKGEMRDYTVTLADRSFELKSVVSLKQCVWGFTFEEASGVSTFVPHGGFELVSWVTSKKLTSA